ncbi:hypothetical protein BGW38_007370, partial [Lunasporangiospora selenospora]
KPTVDSDPSEDEEEDNVNQAFFALLLRHVYSGERLGNSKNAPFVREIGGASSLST